MGGLSISTDGGNTFTNKDETNGLGYDTVKGVYVSGLTVYAATSKGLSISTDGGKTFTNKTTTNGLGTNAVNGVYVDGTTIYAATNNGLSIAFPATPGYASTPASGSPINVGSANVGATITQTLVVSETGNATLTIANATIGGAGASNFKIATPTFPLTIADGKSSQNVVLVCTPSISGLLTATLTITHNATGSPATYPLSCLGTTPGYGSHPTMGSTINVGSATVGTTVSTTLTISETGNATLTVTNHSVSGINGANFSVSPSSLTIADGGVAQNLTLTCKPTTAGLLTATLTITHNATGSPATYPLNCTGLAPGYSSNPKVGSTINVGSVTVGSTVSTTLTISETGNATLTVTNHTVSGANGANFSVSPASLTIADGGAAQNLTLSCQPKVSGTLTATLTVNHNGLDSPATYPLNCTALAISTPTPTPTITVTATVTVTATPTTTPVITGTVTPTPVITGTVTPTPVITGTVTPTPVITATVTPTPVITATVTPTPVITGTVTPTPVITGTVTATPTSPSQKVYLPVVIKK